jgi:2-dehydro-3-deoxyphosphooctonate aldolase (KDO 8-P synthase)
MEQIMGNTVYAGNIKIEDKGPFFIIAGPCVIESEEITMRVASFLKETSEKLDIPIIFKTSYDKANRTSVTAYRGPGIEKGLEIIMKVKEKTGLPVLSDIHGLDQVDKAADVLDVLQIPAFLSRQTDLLVKAGKSGKTVIIKNGQFVSPVDFEQAVKKVLSTGNRNIMLTERGTFFGYNNLVVDFRGIPIMKGFGFPIVFDATHSVQLPGGDGTCSGGERKYASYLARAAVAAGANGVFMEVHPDPDNALCDGPNSLPLEEVKPLLIMLKDIHSLVN